MNVRIRLIVAGLCAIALVVGGTLLERIGPRPVSAGSPRESISGIWSCPHGGGEGWRAWVTVANPGEDQVEVRLTTSAGGAAPEPATSVIEPQTLRYFEVGTSLPGSATRVEYLGGTVAAGSVVMPPDGGIAAEPCAGDPGPSWNVTEASTLRGETAYLVVHNPFAAQAVVDVTLTTPEGQIHPGRLQGVVLGPFAARAFELNHFVLGEKALAAEVVAPQGRVAAESLVISRGAARSSLAVPAPATRWILPGAGAETEVVVRALRQEDAPVGAEIQGEDGAIPALDLEVVSAATARSFGLLQADGGFLVRSDGPQAMVAGRRMFLEERAPAAPPSPADQGSGGGKGQGGGAKESGGKPSGGKPSEDAGGAGRDRQGGAGGKEEEPPPELAGDIAATSGAPTTADRWLVPPAVGPGGGPSVVLLQNPGEEEVTTSVTLIGTGGPLGPAATVTVPARSTVRFAIPGGNPAAALVEGGELVAAQATLAPGAFAVALGLAI